LDGVRNLFFGRLFRVILKIEDVATQEWPFLIDLQNLESLPALGDNVHLAVVITLGDGDDLGGAAHVGDPFLLGAYNAERDLLLETLVDQFLITRLKDVQGQGSARKEHNVQGEQWQERLQSISGWNGGPIDCTPRLDLPSPSE